MAYTQKTWVSGETPLSADNFNHMEEGIAAAHEDISEVSTRMFKWETVNFSDYITINSGFTINVLNALKRNNEVILYYDLKGTISQYQTVLGTCKKTLLTPSFGSARVGTGTSGVTYPATLLCISNGEFRLHSSVSGTTSAGSIHLILAN